MLVLLGTISGLQAAEPKYNVLFIATDDWRPEIHCYGVEGIKTPHVDALAASGVRFDRAYCQFPLCNPSRTSMLTGRHPFTTGALDNDVAFRDAHPDWISLPQHFRSHGYSVARTGKIFHGGIDDPQAWDEVLDARQAKPAAQQQPGVAPRLRVLPVAQQPAGQRPRQDPAKSDRIVELEGDGGVHVDYHTAQNGIALLEKYRDKPFFVAVGFLKPHSPPTAPKKFFDLYEAAQVPLPIDFMPKPKLPKGFPAACLPMRSGDLFINREASPEAAREMKRAYWASASWTDFNVGQVLAALDRLGLAKNTIVVYFGDHGYHLGEKGKWSKHGSLFEVATRVPLVIRLPGAAGNGAASGRTVQLADLYPTLAELCSLPAPDGLEGHSLAALLRDPGAAWNHPAYSVCRNAGTIGESIRTERWRYSRWDEGRAGELLFDEQNDPHEQKNLAADPEYADVVKQLRSQLTQQFPTRPK